MNWDVDKSVANLTANAKPTFSEPGECAAYVRDALEKGGLTILVPPRRYVDATGASACDYGESLLAAGFKIIFDNSSMKISQKIDFKPVKGDVAIYHLFEGHRHGHIQMFNGIQWISDFLQRNQYPDQFPGLYPGPGYRKIEPPLKIYRNDSLQIINYTSANKLPWQ
jgi:hypothetical protein